MVDRPLLSCPFCGHTDVRPHRFRDIGEGEEHFVQCYGCTTLGPPRKTADEAVQAWNERAPAPPPPDPVKLHEHIMRVIRAALPHHK